MTKNIALVLSGCGVQDGSEIHEATLTLLAASKHGATITGVAPNRQSNKTINHLTGEEMAESRNILIESARIMRGNIKDIQSVNGADFDAVIFPGGFGAALNLCNFAEQGESFALKEDILNFAKQAHDADKPLGFICIAPVMIPKITGSGSKLTIGHDHETKVTLEKLGCVHIDSKVSEIVIDEENKIVSTPAYMLANSISEANSGIEKLVAAVLDLA